MMRITMLNRLKLTCHITTSQTTTVGTGSFTNQSHRQEFILFI